MGPGPWVDEPDKVQWFDDRSGLACVVKRNHSGVWCGYVAVAANHPAATAENGTDALVVHGDVTYGPSPCQPHDESEDGEAHAICHIVEPGEDDNVMWIGFDCGHYMDFSPGMEASLSKYREPGEPTFNDIMGGIVAYKTIDFAKDQCRLLAAQLSAMAKVA